VLGEGNTSCGSWLEQRRDPQLWKNEASWVLGYLSAINQFVWHGGANIIRGIDPAGVEAWLDAHCAANPLDDIQTSTQTLFNELVQRRKQRN
jgi:hypothetical protein